MTVIQSEIRRQIAGIATFIATFKRLLVSSIETLPHTLNRESALKSRRVSGTVPRREDLLARAGKEEEKREKERERERGGEGKGITSADSIVTSLTIRNCYASNSETGVHGDN